jgi:hypothetical protein
MPHWQIGIAMGVVGILLAVVLLWDAHESDPSEDEDQP